MHVDLRTIDTITHQLRILVHMIPGKERVRLLANMICLTGFGNGNPCMVGFWAKLRLKHTGQYISVSFLAEYLLEGGQL